MVDGFWLRVDGHGDLPGSPLSTINLQPSTSVWLNARPINRLVDVNAQELFANRFGVFLRRAGVEHEDAVALLDRAIFEQDLQCPAANR